MDRVKSIPGGFLLIGIMVGLGLNYLWEAFRLPGYGQKLFRITPGEGQGGPAGSKEVWFAADDAAEIGIGAIIMFVARKDRHTLMFGLGIMIGVLLTKLFEVYQEPGSTIGQVKIPGLKP